VWLDLNVSIGRPGQPHYNLIIAKNPALPPWDKVWVKGYYLPRKNGFYFYKYSGLEKLSSNDLSIARRLVVSAFNHAGFKVSSSINKQYRYSLYRDPKTGLPWGDGVESKDNLKESILKKDYGFLNESVSYRHRIDIENDLWKHISSEPNGPVPDDIRDYYHNFSGRVSSPEFTELMHRKLWWLKNRGKSPIKRNLVRDRDVRRKLTPRGVNFFKEELLEKANNFLFS
jgi:hypothetical protein